jgi:hypothetical protein
VNAGNVGIGTTGPVLNLQVDAPIGQSGNPIAIGGGAQTKGTARIGNIVQDLFLDFGTQSASPFGVWMQVHNATNATAFPLLLNPNGGNVGIGTTNPSTDKLVVFGDIRVGTAGTNGCIENFAGTALTGSCSSDINLKKNIVPITNILDSFTQLQPVTYQWRSDEFPDRQFGTTPVKGLIAQDVEKLFPELVGMDSNGFKTVDYGIALQVMSIEAIKEMNLNLDAVAGTVVPIPGSSSESFLNAFFSNIKVKMSTWLADAGNGIGSIFTKEINTKTLCVSDDTGAKTCLTKAQLDTLLSNVSGSIVNNTGGNQITTPPATPPAPTVTPAPAVVPTPDSLSTSSGSTTTPVVVPTPTVPVVIPTPASTPVPAITPAPTPVVPPIPPANAVPTSPAVGN